MAKPIRVCQFVGNMKGGGVESVVMNYFHHVDRSKVLFDFVVTESSTFVPRDDIESLGGRVFTVPAYSNYFAFQKASFDLFKAHPEWTIVHAHMNALNVIPLRQAYKAGVPVRISHSHSTANPAERVKTVVKNVLRTQANRYPTDRFACGEYAGKWLFGSGTDFTVMPNAIDIFRFSFSAEKRAALRKSLGIGRETFVVLHIGRFVEQKNHRFLVRIFSELLNRKPDAILLLAGDGPLRPEIERIISERGIEDHVRFLGQRSDTDSLYCAADVFCLPSLYEGMPVVSVEAQASGLPILISSEVSEEVVVTSRASRLPLSAGPGRWSQEIVSNGEGQRLVPLSQVDREALSAYDIELHARWLTDKYLELATGVMRGE